MTAPFIDPLNAARKYSSNILYEDKKFSDLIELIETIELHETNEFIVLSLNSPYENLAFLMAAWAAKKTVINLPKQEHLKSLEWIKDHIISFTHIHEVNKQNFIKEKLTSKNIEDHPMALLVPTSGSSGKSKLVALSLTSLYYSAQGTNQFFQVSEKDKWNLNLPLNHVGGLMILLRSVYGGFSFTENLKDASIVSLVPTQLKRMINNETEFTKIKSMKAVILGGAPMDRELKQACLDNGLPVSLTYGMTETCSMVTATAVGSIDIESNNIGRALPNREIDVIDGRLAIAGNTLFQGYYFSGKIESKLQRIKGKDFFITQDLGRIEDGQVICEGRSDRVIISGGENINLNEIESAIVQETDALECRILPVSDNDYGQVMAAFIQLPKNLSFDIFEKELRTKLKEKLHNYQVPKYFFNLEKVQVKGIKVSLEELQDYAQSEGLQC